MREKDRFSREKERFSSTELTALRNDLLQGGLADSHEAAELLQIFLMGRGYGVAPQAALDAGGRGEMSGGSLPVVQHGLENFAVVVEAGMFNLPYGGEKGIGRGLR